MSGFSKLLAILVVLLLVIALPVALLAFNVGRVVFNPPLVKDIVGDEVVGSDLIPLGLEWFSSETAEGRGTAQTWVTEPDILQLISMLDLEDWRAIKDEVLPEEILREWVSVSVDGVYAWVDNSERVPQVTWDLQSFKDRMNSEHGAQAIITAYSNLEPCTEEQINDFITHLKTAADGVEVLYNLCSFPNEYLGAQMGWYDDQLADYVASLQDVVDNIPSKFELTQELGQSSADTEGVGAEVLKKILRTIRFAMNYAWIAPLVLLLLILVLAVRSLDDLARWWGLPLLISGVIALIPPLTYRPLLTSLLASGPLSETPEVIRQEAIQSILRMASEAFIPLLVQAVVLIIIGVLLSAWLSVRKRQKMYGYE